MYHNENEISQGLGTNAVVYQPNAMVHVNNNGRQAGPSFTSYKSYAPSQPNPLSAWPPNRGPYFKSTLGKRKQKRKAVPSKKPTVLGMQHHRQQTVTFVDSKPNQRQRYDFTQTQWTWPSSYSTNETVPYTNESNFQEAVPHTNNQSDFHEEIPHLNTESHFHEGEGHNYISNSHQHESNDSWRYSGPGFGWHYVPLVPVPEVTSFVPRNSHNYNPPGDYYHSDYSSPYSTGNGYEDGDAAANSFLFVQDVQPVTSYIKEEQGERVSRNPINTVQKTIKRDRDRPSSFDNLSSASKARLKQQASLRTTLDANPTAISLQPTSVHNTPDKLYHYTTEDGAFGIIKDMCLRPKGMEGNWFDPSFRFGNGLYFTDLPPTSKTETILLNNYNKIILANVKYTEFCFEFRSKDLPDLLLCVDSTCNPKESLEERRRKIWVSKVKLLNLKRFPGGLKYYFRELNGIDEPKEVKELPL